MSKKQLDLVKRAKANHPNWLRFDDLSPGEKRTANSLHRRGWFFSFGAGPSRQVTAAPGQ